MKEYIDNLTEVFTGLDRTCINVANLERHCPLDNRLSFPSAGFVAQHDRLSALPIELRHEILGILDLTSLTVMRRVSRHLRDSITSLKAYADVVEYAPQLLRALLSTNTGSEADIQRLHRLVFTDSKCTGGGKCDHFGPLVHLPTCRRVCYDCIHDERELLRYPSIQLLKQLWLVSAEVLERVRVLKTIPGAYGAHKLRLESTPLVSLADLNEVRRKRDEHPFLDSWLKPHEQTREAEVRGLCLSVRVPFIDRSTKKELLPRVCYGCLKVDSYKGLRNVVTFTKDAYMAHVDSCPASVANLVRLEAGEQARHGYFKELFRAYLA